MASITLSHLSFAYPGSADNIFTDVSLRLDTSWRLGFIGRNGRGKTTLLRILMGEFGHIGGVSADVVFDYFPFALPDFAESPRKVAEEMLDIENLWRFECEADLLALDDELLDRPLCTLSCGEQTKVQLAMLFARENHFLLIDEPTNHLDMEGRRMMAEYLKKKQGFILVSHDRAFLDGCIDHVLSINRANIEVQKGNYTSWEHNKALQDQYELDENERLKGEINRLQASARRTAEWAQTAESEKIGTHSGDRGFIGARAARVMKKAQNALARRQSAVEEKSGLLHNIDRQETLKITGMKHHAERLVSVIDLVIAYDGKTIAKNINFEIHARERVAVTGPNGCGKSSLLRLICGDNIPHTGLVRTASGLTLSVVPQDTSFLKGDLRAFIQENAADETLFKTILRKFGFPREQFDKDMQEYSAGQKKKVLLANSLCKPSHLYVWDEPLNYIDVLSRVQIETLLAESDAAMLFVSHDRMFVEHIADKTIQLKGVTK